MFSPHTFEEISPHFDPELHGAQSGLQEEVIITYTRGSGRFSPDKKYIALAMQQFTLDDEPEGWHQGVWEAQFKDPRELLARPPNPAGPMNEPRGPVPHLPVVAYTKGIWVFRDGSSITAVGPALSHLVPLDDGSFLFAVTCGQIITNGTGRFARARGLKTSLGSTHIEKDVDLFGPGDVHFTATTIDTFRVVREPASGPIG
ncbi:MAG TPA: hypothetical protein VHE60_10380 [Pyrinomonadaceae bacterium]|nr:hypothetical protein [Pyrinomonadaceae bacterium]